MLFKWRDFKHPKIFKKTWTFRWSLPPQVTVARRASREILCQGRNFFWLLEVSYIVFARLEKNPMPEICIVNPPHLKCVLTIDPHHRVVSIQAGFASPKTSTPVWVLPLIAHLWCLAFLDDFASSPVTAVLSFSNEVNRSCWCRLYYFFIIYVM